MKPTQSTNMPHSTLNSTILIPLIAVGIFSFNQIQAALLVDLDATIFESISGNPVTQWTNQSDDRFHAKTTEGRVRYPSSYVSASGLIGVDFSGGRSRMEILDAKASKRLLDFSDGTGGFSMMIAFTVQRNSDNHIDVSPVIANSDRTHEGFFIRYHENRNELEFSLANRQKVGKIVDGDTVVVGANYDADTGAYTVKVITSSGEENTTTGIIPPSDFSTEQELSLGNATYAQRHLEGMIGKVLIYGNELSEANFLDQIQQLKQIWIEPKTQTLGLILF